MLSPTILMSSAMAAPGAASAKARQRANLRKDIAEKPGRGNCRYESTPWLTPDEKAILGRPAGAPSIAAVTPAPVAPRRQPESAFRRLLRRRIEAGRAPGMTAADTRRAHPAAGPQPVTLDRLV